VSMRTAPSQEFLDGQIILESRAASDNQIRKRRFAPADFDRKSCR
jgi:hypothetical protein